MSSSNFYEVTYLCPDYSGMCNKGQDNKIYVDICYKSKKMILPLTVLRASELMAQCELQGHAMMSMSRDTELFQRYGLGGNVKVRVKDSGVKSIFVSEGSRFTVLSLVPLQPMEK